MPTKTVAFGVTVFLVVAAVITGISRSDSDSAATQEPTQSTQTEDKQLTEPETGTVASSSSRFVTPETENRTNGAYAPSAPVEGDEEEVFRRRVHAFEAAYWAQEPSDTPVSSRQRIERYVADEATLEALLSDREALDSGTSRTVVDVYFQEIDLRDNTAAARVRVSLILQGDGEEWQISEESVTTWVKSRDSDEWLIQLAPD